MSDHLAAAATAIRTVNGTSFSQLVLDTEWRVLVEFMSYGCGYCRAIDPILQLVATTIQADETIMRVNIASEPDLATQYAITGTPTFVMFLDGVEVGRQKDPIPPA